MNIFEEEAGENIFTVVARCKVWLTNQHMDFCSLTFNGIRIMCSIDSNPDDIVAIYNLKARLRQLGEKV